MSIILALATVIGLMIVGYFRRSGQRSQAVSPVLVKRYIHPGHTWARETEDGDVIVGIDDFAQSLIGGVEGIELPRLLRRVEQGKTAWTIRRGMRAVPMVSPVSGRVIEKNEMVMTNPGLVNTSPYGDGWLLRIRPRRFPMEIHNLITGRSASQWVDGARARLAGFFSGAPVLMYQDGGVMLTDLADRCSDEEWDRLIREFFLADTHTKQH